MKTLTLILSIAILLTGCADFAYGLQSVADEMAAQNAQRNDSQPRRPASTSANGIR
jgi:PBP1b-binding outer membrane lipoprotein LpoB